MKKLYPPVFFFFSCVLSSCAIRADIKPTGETIIDTLGSGTVFWNRDLSFDEDEKYNNTLNNTNLFGKVAYHDHSLYVNYFNDILAFSKGEIKKLDLSYLKSETKTTDSSIFTFNDKLCLYPIANPKYLIYHYNPDADKVTESNLNISSVSYEMYLSNDFCVYRSQDWNTLHIKSANGEWEISDKVEQFNISGNEIYYTKADDEAWLNPELYCYSLQDKKSRYLTTLEHGYVHAILISGNICYYTSGDGSLYACSLDDFKTKKVLDDAQCFNAINDKVYALTSKRLSDFPGVYSVENARATKIADIEADSIYTFGEEYIYTYDPAPFCVCRVNVKDGSVEKVFEVKQ